MWQVALGAALAAGSGFLAKKLVNPNAPPPFPGSNQNHPKSDQPSHQNSLSSYNLKDPDSIFASGAGTKEESLGEESIFRFSSSPGSERGSNNLRNKIGCGSRRNKGKVEGFKRNGDGKVVKKCGGLKKGYGVDQRSNGSGKKFYVCLKKRRTSKTAPGKCDTCSSKENSILGWGLGIGMMCIMSARRAEINKLNNAMDETSKAVEELEGELCRRKTSHDLHASNSEYIKGEHMEPAFVKLCTEDRNDKRIFSFPVTEEGEYASSVLTDEFQPEAQEMDQLEAELESELLKLHGCSMDDYETGVLAEGIDGADEDLGSYKPNGVLPSELHQKLSQVLIEQQESHIMELESELQRSHHKLHEKEAELQALKDCVRRLTEFSLDEVTEGHVEQQHSRIIVENDEEKQNMGMGADFRKSTVGNKRTSMDF